MSSEHSRQLKVTMNVYDLLVQEKRRRKKLEEQLEEAIRRGEGLERERDEWMRKCQILVEAVEAFKATKESNGL